MPHNIESSLDKIFHLATAWNAIVLIDEADVYLCKRDNDIAKNAAISIFLKTLEYYTGILFLTTNIIDNFDKAFNSRITMKLEYKSLGYMERKAIWMRTLRNTDHSLSEDDLEELSKIDLNGREIFNIIKICINMGDNITLEILKDYMY